MALIWVFVAFLSSQGVAFFEKELQRDGEATHSSTFCKLGHFHLLLEDFAKGKRIPLLHENGSWVTLWKECNLPLEIFFDISKLSFLQIVRCTFHFNLILILQLKGFANAISSDLALYLLSLHGLEGVWHLFSALSAYQRFFNAQQVDYLKVMVKIISLIFLACVHIKLSLRFLVLYVGFPCAFFVIEWEIFKGVKIRSCNATAYCKVGYKFQFICGYIVILDLFFVSCVSFFR